MSDDRPIVYEEDGKWIYRVSASGSCVRYLVAAALGYEDQRGKKTDDLLERSADEGNLHEDAIVSGLTMEGILVVDRQRLVEIQVLPNVFLRGHIEGLLDYGEHTPRQLFEAKSMSTKQFTKWTNHEFGEFDRYAYQITTYMQAYPDLDCRYIVKRREDGFQTEVLIKAGQTPVPFKTIRNKIIAAEKWRRKGELPPCDLANTWGCPVWYLHDEAEDAEIVPISEEMQVILGELIAEYVTLKMIEDQGKEAEKARKEINPEILNLLGKLDQTEVVHNGIKYRVTRRKGGGSSLDKAKVKDMIGSGDIEDAMTPFSYQYPVISVVKPN